MRQWPRRPRASGWLCLRGAVEGRVKRIRYVIFDAPTVAGGISQRLDAARAALARLQDGGKPHAEVLEQRVCRGVEHVKQELKKVEALKGEGLMLRHPTAEHRGGRTSDLLKVKSFLDAEAVVLAHIEGKGKHQGRMGALDAGTRPGKSSNSEPGSRRRTAKLRRWLDRLS